MTEKGRVVSGGCMCGAVRYEATGAPQGSGYCHCRSCRHHTGAPIVAFVVFTADQVEWLSGDRTVFESSPGILRAFCRDCGTSLTYECSELVELHISTLDNPDEFPPNEHTHYGERISWFETADKLTRYKGTLGSMSD